jgi:Xaa-Pro aminopeptidase
VAHNRLACLLKLLRKKKCTHLLISDPLDVRSICGFDATSANLLLSPVARILITDFRYRDAARALCRRERQWRFIEAREGGFDVLPKLVRRGSRLGVQANVMTLEQGDALRKRLRGVSIVKISTEIAECLAPKEPSELDLMRKAARIADQALRRLIPRLKAGVTEQEAARMLDRTCCSLGSEKPSFDTIVLFGARSALPHGVPSNVQLRRGDWVLIDFGCTVEGYCSDMTRTMVAGKASRRQRAFYEIVREAQTRARESIRAGKKAGEIDGIARNMIAAAGYGKAFGHATGHGVGLRIHEFPRLRKKDKTILKIGMVVTVEPGIYVSKFGGVRIEDMVAVTDTGCEVLSRSPRELIELDL